MLLAGPGALKNGAGGAVVVLPAGPGALLMNGAGGAVVVFAAPGVLKNEAGGAVAGLVGAGVPWREREEEGVRHGHVEKGTRGKMMDFIAPPRMWGACRPSAAKKEGSRGGRREDAAEEEEAGEDGGEVPPSAEGA